MTMERMYTTREVAKILNIDYKRVAKDLSQKILKPTDIEKGIGRGGVRYVFDADAVRFYASKRGIHDVDFSLVGGEEDVIDEDGGIVLTPENFNRIVHGEDNPVNATTSGDVRFLKRFMESNNMEIKDVAYIFGKSEQAVRNLLNGQSSLKFEEVMALCVAAKTSDVSFDLKDYFANDPGRYKTLSEWVPYKKAKLMQEYSDLQARMKEIEKELGGKCNG